MIDPSDDDKARAYARAGLEHAVPPFVPARIRLRGDLVFAAAVAEPGEHDYHCNRYGAVSVRATNGDLLGLKPAEFEVVAWRPNTPSDVAQQIP